MGPHYAIVLPVVLAVGHLLKMAGLVCDTPTNKL